MKPPKLFLTCEHAGNKIPARYKKLFAKNQGVLRTHRGSDPGAAAIAREVAKQTRTPLYSQKISRLVVDMNRSVGSDTLLSRWTKSLPPADQQRILDEIYRPYRNLIYDEVDRALRNARVVHIGIHSFSPYLDPARRSCHIGILFDPRSRFETKTAEILRDQLALAFPRLGIRMNYPYRGDGDGLTTDLRHTHPKTRYAGLELELNQAVLKKLTAAQTLKPFARSLAAAIESALAEL